MVLTSGHGPAHTWSWSCPHLVIICSHLAIILFIPGHGPAHTWSSFPTLGNASPVQSILANWAGLALTGTPRATVQEGGGSSLLQEETQPCPNQRGRSSARMPETHGGPRLSPGPEQLSQSLRGPCGPLEFLAMISPGPQGLFEWS